MAEASVAEAEALAEAIVALLPFHLEGALPVLRQALVALVGTTPAAVPLAPGPVQRAVAKGERKRRDDRMGGAGGRGR